MSNSEEGEQDKYHIDKTRCKQTKQEKEHKCSITSRDQMFQKSEYTAQITASVDSISCLLTNPFIVSHHDWYVLQSNLVQIWDLFSLVVYERVCYVLYCLLGGRCFLNLYAPSRYLKLGEYAQYQVVHGPIWIQHRTNTYICTVLYSRKMTKTQFRITTFMERT